MVVHLADAEVVQLLQRHFRQSALFQRTEIDIEERGYHVEMLGDGEPVQKEEEGEDVGPPGDIVDDDVGDFRVVSEPAGEEMPHECGAFCLAGCNAGPVQNEIRNHQDENQPQYEIGITGEGESAGFHEEPAVERVQDCRGHQQFKDIPENEIELSHRLLRPESGDEKVRKKTLAHHMDSIDQHCHKSPEDKRMHQSGPDVALFQDLLLAERHDKHVFQPLQRPVEAVLGFRHPEHGQAAGDEPGEDTQ